jgi:hypothetical protein
MPGDVPKTHATHSVRAYPSGLLAIKRAVSISDTPRALLIAAARDMEFRANLKIRMFSELSSVK